MGDITRTKANVRPLAGAVIVRGEAGGTIEAGELVYLNGTSGWTVGDGSAAGTALIRGMMVSPKDAVDGDKIDICVFGPVEGFTGMTPGATHFASDTDGELATTNGAATLRAGWALSATIFFVAPAISADPT